MQKCLNTVLDKMTRPTMCILARRVSMFQVCGYTGLFCSIVLTMALCIAQGLSLLMMDLLVLAAAGTFFLLALLTKILIGEEKLIYYHQEIAVMMVSSLLLWLLHEPLLPYLDIAILGIGTFLTFGRIGCFMVGCCHGRPHSWGICYREEHAVAGFTPYYVGVRLFPIQTVESLWVGCIVFVGSFLVLSGSPSGTALAWYVVTYDLGRFCFEFMRGDPERPYLWGFSQAQWISLLLMCVVVWAELAGFLTFHLWHAAVATFLVLMMVMVSLNRRFRKNAQHRLMHPHHVRELAEVIAGISRQTTERNADLTGIRIGSTSLGVQISASTLQGDTDLIYHYALSSKEGIMTEETAKTLALLICQLKHQTGSDELIGRNRGVFHLLIHSSAH